MSEIMMNRFREICPVKYLKNMDILEVRHDVMVAFKIIGFSPDDFEDAFKEAWSSSNAHVLSDFVYDVWWCSDES